MQSILLSGFPTKQLDLPLEEALLLESSILALRPPTKQSHAAFRNYFMNRDCSRIDFPTLTGASETLYDDREDLVALKRQAEEDRLSAFFRKHMGFFFQVLINQPHSEQDS